MMQEQTNIIKTSFILMIIVIITKMSGFLSTAIIAKQLGDSRPNDLFIIANTIPEILGNLILVGVISAAFIPVLIRVETLKGKDAFLSLYNTLLNFSLITFVFVSILLAIGAEFYFPYLLNNLIKPTTKFTDQDIQNAIWMLRLLLVPQIILGISTFYTSALNVYNRFLLPQFAPLLYNIGRVIGALLIPVIGDLQGLVWGTILGAVLHLAIQAPLVFQLGVMHRPQMNLKDADFRESVKIGLPRIVSLGAEYIAGGIDKFIAARFVIGSVTAYDYAARLISIPLSVFGLTFSIASFPSMAKLYQSGDKENFSKLFVKLMHQILFLAIPATVIILILRISLVRLLFGIFGGAFSFEATYRTAWTVSFFAIGLSFESLRTLIYRAFYAANDTTRPLFASLFTVIGGIGTGILFTNYFSHFDAFDFRTIHWGSEYFFNPMNGKAAIGGLALSSSLIFTIEFFILLFTFHFKITKLDLKSFFWDLLKKILAAAIMGVTMFLFFRLWGDSEYQEVTVNLIIFVGMTCLLGAVTYLLSCFVLNIKEFEIFRNFMFKLLNIKVINNFTDKLNDYLKVKLT